MNRLLAGLLAGLAVLVAVPPRPRRLATLPQRSGGARQAPGRRPAQAGRCRAPGRGRLHLLPGVAGALVVVAVVAGPVSGGPSAALGLLVPAALLGQHARARARRAAAQVRRRRREVAEAASVLATELHAGRTPQDALGEAASTCEALLPAAAAARIGADVVTALRAASATPGAEALVVVAAAWQVTERTGAPLAVLSARTADAVRAEEALHREVAGQLASVRSTGRLLAALPLGTLALGTALGGSPWQVVVGTPWGAACALAGLGLALAGTAWTARIAGSAERSPWAP